MSIRRTAGKIPISPSALRMTSREKGVTEDEFNRAREPMLNVLPAIAAGE